MSDRCFKSADDLMLFAGELALTCDFANGLVIYLQGELGAGKTTFARGFLRGLGYVGVVKSPTYTIVEPYRTQYGLVYHFDLYRIGSPEELYGIGVESYFAPQSICLIEWPDCGAGVIPAANIVIDIQFSNNNRLLTLQNCVE